MANFTTPGLFGVSSNGWILTALGWRTLADIQIGTALAHPTGYGSQLIAKVPIGDVKLARLGIADGTEITITENQPIDVLLGDGRHAPQYLLDPRHINDALLRGRRVQLPRHNPYAYGQTTRSLDPHLMGILLGDGYLRERSVTLCNQDPAVHRLVAAQLPDGAMLTSMRIGQAGTGSADIIGTVRPCNPVLAALREMGLTGKRAWEKFIPAAYLEGSLVDRLALLQGILDTDGHCDRYGRISFASSSRMLCEQVLELIQGLGGRARQRIYDDVMFTSPRQLTPKRGRDAHLLSNIRLPEDMSPFRLERKLARVRPGRTARQWTIKEVTSTGTGNAVAVVVSAADGQWISSGPVALAPCPDAQRAYADAA